MAAPNFAFAQVSVPTNDAGTQQALVGKSTGGILGSLSSAISQVDGAISKITSTACVTSQVSSILSAVDNVNQWTFGGLSLLTSNGQTSQAAAIELKMEKLSAARDCLESEINQLNAQKPGSILQAQQIQTLLAQYTKEKNTIDARFDVLVDQYTVATQSIWKTILITSLLNISKSLSINMVNRLVSNYKIADFAQYADAVASEVYDNELIAKNFSGAPADEMIVRSMLTNPIAQSVISPAIYARASAALGFDPATLSYNDPDFYQKLASVGYAQADPYFQQQNMANITGQIYAQAQMNAQAEVAQSGGLKTPRTCLGTLQEQQAIDQSFQAANDQLQNRTALYNKLLSAQQVGMPVKQSDIAQAQADMIAAQKQLQGVPNEVNNKPLIDICQGIVSPPSLISKGIDQAFQALGGNLGKYNNSNLPFFVNFVSDIANQISNNLIFGGGMYGSSIIGENAGNISAAAGMAATYASSDLHGSQKNNMIFTATRSTDVGSGNSALASYNLQWDASNVTNATGVSITGSGLPANTSGLVVFYLSGATTASVPIGGTYTYTLTAYGKSKADVLARTTVTVSPSQPQASQLSAADKLPAGSVAGAFISREPLAVRGPVQALHPRGE